MNPAKLTLSIALALGLAACGQPGTANNDQTAIENLDSNPATNDTLDGPANDTVNAAEPANGAGPVNDSAPEPTTNEHAGHDMNAMNNMNNM